MPHVALRVVDSYTGGEGLLEARLARLPIMRRRGQELAEGEALRYLAELPWVPQAMVANRELEWGVLDERTVEVATHVESATVRARLHFDTDGDIVRASGGARPRVEGKKTVPTPWAGSFGDYAVFGGIRIPTRGEVSWQLADGPFTYWRRTITALEME